MSAYQPEVHRHGDTQPLPTECRIKALDPVGDVQTYCFIFRNNTQSESFSNRDGGSRILARLSLNASVNAQKLVKKAWEEKGRPVPFLATPEDAAKLEKELDQIFPPTLGQH